jgi:hypothetical protein
LRTPRGRSLEIAERQSELLRSRGLEAAPPALVTLSRGTFEVPGRAFLRDRRRIRVVGRVEWSRVVAQPRRSLRFEICICPKFPAARRGAALVVARRAAHAVDDRDVARGSACHVIRLSDPARKSARPYRIPKGSHDAGVRFSGASDFSVGINPSPRSESRSRQ